MRKLLLVLGLLAASIPAAAAGVTPETSSGNSDIYAGLKSSCTFNLADESIMNVGRGVVFSVWASTGSDASLTDFYQLYDSSSSANCGSGGFELSPRTVFAPNAATAGYQGSNLPQPLAGGLGVRYTDGLCVKITGTAATNEGVCTYYLDLDTGN